MQDRRDFEYEILDGRYDFDRSILRRRLDQTHDCRLRDVFGDLSEAAQAAILRIVKEDQAGVFRGVQFAGEPAASDPGTASENKALAAIFGAAAVPHGLPDQAPELYAGRPDRKEKPPAFIKRVYGDWLGRGLTQADIGRLDRPLYMALHNWLRHHAMPADIDLPSKKALNDRLLQNGPPLASEARGRALREVSPETREQMRLYGVAHTRAWRQKKTLG